MKELRKGAGERAVRGSWQKSCQRELAEELSGELLGHGLAQESCRYGRELAIYSW